MKKFYLVIVAAICCLFAWLLIPTSELAADLQEKESENNTILISSEQIQSLGIQTENAKPNKVSLVVSTRGKIILHPDKLAHIVPKISGVVKEAKKNIGDFVEEGDVIAILESSEMAHIKADFLAAKEKETHLHSYFQQEELLHEKKISAAQDFFAAKTAYKEAQIQVKLAEQKLHTYGVEDAEIAHLSQESNPELKMYEIRSPMSGSIIYRHLTKGEYVENNETIYEIADLSHVWVEMGIYPTDLSKVKVGQKVNVTLTDDQKPSIGKIIYLSPIIQDDSIATKAIAEMKNRNQKWRPGSFVKVDIVIDNVDAPVAISHQAIQEIDGKECVFLKTDEGFEKREVKTGLKDEAQVEILSGLDAGDEYANSNTFLLKADLKKDEEGVDD